MEWCVLEDQYDYKYEIQSSSYADMLNDNDRNNKYYNALQRVINEIKLNGKRVHVLDIGCGSGILSMMALKLGADKVTACESFEPIYRCAHKVVKDNGLLSDKIDLIHESSLNLKVGVNLSEKANVLVSEIFDSELIGEGVLQVFEHAVNNLLTSDAQIIPHSAQLFVQPVKSQLLQDNNRLREIKYLTRWPNSFYSCLGYSSSYDVQASSLVRDSSFSVVGPANLVKVIDFSRINCANPCATSLPWIEDREIDAFVLWWKLIMTETGGETISTAPSWTYDNQLEYQWRDHWLQIVLYTNNNAGSVISSNYEINNGSASYNDSSHVIYKHSHVTSNISSGADHMINNDYNMDVNVGFATHVINTDSHVTDIDNSDSLETSKVTYVINNFDNGINHDICENKGISHVTNIDASSTYNLYLGTNNDSYVRRNNYYGSNNSIYLANKHRLRLMHDTHSIWIDSKGSNDKPWCTCGLHIHVPRSRLCQLNSDEYRKQVECVAKHVETDNCRTCVVISDFSYLPLALSNRNITTYNIIDNDIMRQLVESFFDSSHVTFSSLAALPRVLIDAVIGEPFFLGSMLPWDDLHFWYAVDKIRDQMTNNCLISPKKMTIKVMLVKFDQLHKIESPVGLIHGFTMNGFNELNQSNDNDSCEGHLHLESKYLWEYDCWPRSDVEDLLTLDLTTSVSELMCQGTSDLSGSHSFDRTTYFADINGVVMWTTWEVADDIWMDNSLCDAASLSKDKKIPWKPITRQAVHFFKCDLNKLNNDQITISCLFNLAKADFKFYISF